MMTTTQTGIPFRATFESVASCRMHRYNASMHTVRMTMNVDKTLLDEVIESHPGVTKTALVEEGLRALLARAASERLAKLGGKGPRARQAKRSVWQKK